MVSRALESAQTKIEGFNFDSRKHVLEFDNVLDKQRRAIYERRRKILVGNPEEVAGVLGELAGESEEAKKLLAKKEEELGTEQFLNQARGVLLQTLDLLWVEHLESMEYLRGSVNLRAYGQRDPLTEYRKEGTHIYKQMEESFRGNVFEMLEKLNTTAPDIEISKSRNIERSETSKSRNISDGAAVGRNDQCPCGSNKKWKHCGLKNTEEHQRLLAEKK